MFTGIVQGTAELVAIDSLPNFRTHVIRMPSPAWGEGLALGASVAHNGCCLTVTRVEGDLVSFDLMQETLRLTNLGQLVVGDKVNVERAARFGDEIGGHAMSGHIMGTAEVTSVALLTKSVAGWPFPNPLIPLNSLAGEQAYQALSACSSPSRQPGFRPPGRCSSAGSALAR